MNSTLHAVTRFQQRGITDEIADLVCTFGTPKRRPGKVFAYQITKEDRQRIVQENKGNRRVLQLLDKAIKKTIIVDEYSSSIITGYNFKGV